MDLDRLLSATGVRPSLLAAAKRHDRARMDRQPFDARIVAVRALIGHDDPDALRLRRTLWASCVRASRSGPRKSRIQKLRLLICHQLYELDPADPLRDPAVMRVPADTLHRLWLAEMGASKRPTMQVKIDGIRARSACADHDAVRDVRDLLDEHVRDYGSVISESLRRHLVAHHATSIDELRDAAKTSLASAIESDLRFCTGLQRSASGEDIAVDGHPVNVKTTLLDSFTVDKLDQIILFVRIDHHGATASFGVRSPAADILDAWRQLGCRHPPVGLFFGALNRDDKAATMTEYTRSCVLRDSVHVALDKHLWDLGLSVTGPSGERCTRRSRALGGIRQRRLPLLGSDARPQAAALALLEFLNSCGQHETTHQHAGLVLSSDLLAREALDYLHETGLATRHGEIGERRYSVAPDSLERLAQISRERA